MLTLSVSSFLLCVSLSLVGDGLVTNATNNYSEKKKRPFYVDENYKLL